MKIFYGKAFIHIGYAFLILFGYAVFWLVVSLVAPNPSTFHITDGDYAVGSER